MASKITSRSESVTLGPTPMVRRSTIAHSSLVRKPLPSRSIVLNIIMNDTSSGCMPLELEWAASLVLAVYLARHQTTSCSELMFSGNPCASALRRSDNLGMCVSLVGSSTTALYSDAPVRGFFHEAPWEGDRDCLLLCFKV